MGRPEINCGLPDFVSLSPPQGSCACSAASAAAANRSCRPAAADDAAGAMANGFAFTALALVWLLLVCEREKRGGGRKRESVCM